MYKFEHADGDVRRWTLTDDGARSSVDDAYAPALYVTGAERGDGAVERAREHLSGDPRVRRATVERRRRGFRHDPEPMCRVETPDHGTLRAVAGDVRGWGTPGDYRLFDVDLDPGFRYCLDAGVDPTPDRDLTALELAAEETQLASDAVTDLRVDGDRIEGSPGEVVDAVDARVREADPDVLLLSSSALVPQLFGQADRCDRTDFRLGRREGYERLAGDSTYTSYGRVGHSPARYDVPGRALVDRSNTFLWNQSNLDGCRYLVGRSALPLQELARSSIGSVLVAMQTRLARERGVLVPWRSWRHERFKTMRQLDSADRGGVTLAPEVGFHETVHELDFRSLYPNVIVTRNVSPETVRCDCHDTDDVPGLGYSVCPDRDGYLGEVLEPLIDDRTRFKRELRATDDADERARLRGMRSAIKWVLVACFGYQGFDNAKFGRIEAHEAINAHAREILLDAKATLEAGGWRVVHGIVDSLWVTPREADPEPLADLREAVTREAGIELEYEGAYDWLAFCPRRDDDAGALTKYVGRRSDPAPGEDRYKLRGIEARQRSTSPFVADAQRALIARLDETREPTSVCAELRGWCDRLAAGRVPVADLVITQRLSKRADAYERETRGAAAAARADHVGVPTSPGQSVEYVVRDDDAAPLDRVRLAFEADDYDAGFYRDRLVRAAESVLAPVGWRRDRIERRLADRVDASLSAF